MANSVVATTAASNAAIHSYSASLQRLRSKQHNCSTTHLPFPLHLRKSKRLVNSSGAPKAIYSGGSLGLGNGFRKGIWSVRDDLVMPSSPFFPVDTQAGQGPPPMVQEKLQSVISQLFQHRIIRCGGAVDDDMANIIVGQLLYLDAIDPNKDIIMYVNSPGGSVTAGMAIFDTMRHIRPDVSTVCVGLAASMGAFLLSAGTKGKRYSLPNSRIMIHQPLVEGLQALKPRNDILHSNALLKEKSLSNSQIPNTVENGRDNGGINLETSMVIARNEKNLDTTSWAVENIKFSVKDPIEAVATKGELEQLLFLCRSEVDSIGRIAAGIIRIFKLEESFGKGAINQLRNLGTDSLDQFLSPKKLSSQNSNRVINLSDSNITNGSLHHNLDATVSSLEAVLSESQEKCATLVVELNNPDISRQHLADIKQLNQNLESLQVLVTKLRTQI